MTTEHEPSRRRFLRYASVGGVLVPMFVGPGFPQEAKAFAPFHIPKDPKNMTDMEKLHTPVMVLPPVVEDGSQAPVTVEMDHPMEPDHYIKSIQLLNFADPIVIKGQFYFTPANGEVFFSTQIRLAGGEGTVWCIAECNQHGKWAVSKDVKVAAGGC